MAILSPEQICEIQGVAARYSQREEAYRILRDQLYDLTAAIDISVNDEDHFRSRVRCYLAMHESATTPASLKVPGTVNVVIHTGPCSHRWAHAPTVGYISCMDCSEQHGHESALYKAVTKPL